jgi:long-chain acyl-CoA synthetase
MTIPRPEPRGYPGNLGLLFARHAQSERTAVIEIPDDGPPRETSFRGLDTACNAFARGLVRSGLKPGDRIGILSPNHVQFIVTLFGAMRAGVVPVPINIKLPPDTVSYILTDAAVRLVFAEAEWKRLIPDGTNVVLFGKDFEGFLDSGPFSAFEPAPDSVAIQPYTSGSTGLPKGVVLSHYGQNWSRLILAHTRGTTPRDVILVAAPLYHKNALNAIKQGLTAGATLRLLRQFSIDRYIEAIGRYQCTVISGVPTMIAMILTHKDLLENVDTSSVRTVMMGSAASSPQLLREIKSYFPNAEPLVVYGTAGRLRRYRGRAGAAGAASGGKAAPPGLNRSTLCRHGSEACGRAPCGRR